MSAATTFEGELIGKERRIEVTVGYGSRYSLLATIQNNQLIPYNEQFDELSLKANGSNISFGPCFLITDDNIGKFNGRIVFAHDAYNFDSFFQNTAAPGLEGHFHNLPLIRSQKDRIEPLFKEYTQNLLYDLNVHKTFFDDLDRKLQLETDSVRRAAQNAIIETEGRKFLRFFDQSIDDLQKIVKNFSKEENERHGFYFRRMVWHLILTSDFLARTNIKPRGYQGDSEMMRMTYVNDYEGSSIFGKLLHKHPIETPAAQAVRNRRKYIPEILHETLGHFPKTGKHAFRIMSIACGPAWEMQDVFAGSDSFDRFHLTLLDQDVEALGEAASAISAVEKARGLKTRVDYLNESVRTMLRTPKLQDKWGQHHFIYSMGLFDYLTGPVAKAVIKKIFELLKPGGTMIIGNYHVDNPTKTYMDYWMDWVLFYRTETEILSLLADEPKAEASVTFEDSRSQMFLHVRKKA